MVDKLLNELAPQFVDSDEPVMVCEKYDKIKTLGDSDTAERVYIMTFERIYTFKNKLRAQVYSIKDVGAIISSN